MKIASCYNCGYLFEADYKPGFRDECPECTRDVHVCKNCEFWDTTYYNECRENKAERVVDKEKSNFCEYFVFRNEDHGITGKPVIEEKSPRDKFNDLFKD